MGTNPRRLNKYELQERLGAGGMAEVWKALDTELHRYVAVKLLHADLQHDPNFVSRFEREAQLIASLHHPNIIQIYDFHVARPLELSDTLAYMVMDYVEGQTLAQYLHKTSHTGKFPAPADIVHIFTPICLAIDYAHQKGMIHRDIKPSNILLDRRGLAHNAREIGEPVLSDFGIAKLLGTSTSHHSGWWLGTPYYTSPEQAVGTQGNERSDIYALCVILYEICTGTLPFQGENPTAIIMKHVSSLPPPPALINPQIVPELAAVILRGLAKEPAERFPSASSLGIALAETLNLPVAESLRQMVQQITETSHPTLISPVRPQISGPLQPPMQPPAPSPIAAFPSSPLPPDTPTPASIPLPVPAPVVTRQETPAQEFATTPPPAHVARPAGDKVAIPLLKKGHGKKILPLLLALVLFGASVGTLTLLSKRSMPTAVPTTQPIVGYAAFINSGQLNPDDSQGINDEMLVDLHAIPDPPAGKAYYAWLLGDRTQSELISTPLGRLNVTHGAAHLLYTGNLHHSNLLAVESRFLITTEDAGVEPTTYAPDYQAWKYYAELSQATSPKDQLHFSMLDHLRHLLSDAPELKLRSLRGGLDMWYLRNTQKVLEWGSAARDDWRNSPDLLHRQIVRILAYLDGSAYVQKDVPAVGSELLVDPQEDQIALLGPPPVDQDPPGYAFDGEVPPGYTYLISSHLAGTVLSPDATADQRALAEQIHIELDRARSHLENIHQDAHQLVAMDVSQLAQPESLTLLDDLVVQAQLAYTGEADPATGQLQGGAIWICSNIQRMANFAIKAY